MTSKKNTYTNHGANHGHISSLYRSRHVFHPKLGVINLCHRSYLITYSLPQNSFSTLLYQPSHKTMDTNINKTKHKASAPTFLGQGSKAKMPRGVLTEQLSSALKSCKIGIQQLKPTPIGSQFDGVVNSTNLASQRRDVRGRAALSLMKRGGHIGHSAASILQPRLRYPLSSQLLLGKRGTGDAVCPSLSGDQAARGLHLIARILQRGGHILLIDTRGEASPLDRFMEAQARNMPSSVSFGGEHWVGGTLTNWSSISKIVHRSAQISNQFDSFLVSNRVHLPRYEKMRRSYPGFLHISPTRETNTLSNSYQSKIGNNLDAKADTFSKERRLATANNQKSCVKLTGCPDLLLVINPAENRHIIKESERVGIPVVGVIDSNDSPNGITVPVPVNTGSLLWPDGFAIRAVQLAISLQYVES